MSLLQKWAGLSLVLLAASSAPADEATTRYLSEHPAVLLEHAEWHHTHMPDSTAGYGMLFRTFHRGLVGRFIAWRAQSSYGTLSAWAPGPAALLQEGHSNRNGFVRSDGTVIPTPERPSYYTRAGGRARDPSFPRRACRRLGDYATIDELGGALGTGWHNRVHLQLGQAQATPAGRGDMDDFDLAPLDPIFWRWHVYVESVFAEFETVPRRVAPSPASLSFSPTAVGRSRTRRLSLRNTGEGAVSLTIAAPPAPFGVSAAEGSFVLAPRKKRTLVVSFRPAAPGPAAGVLTITTDSPGMQPLRVSLAASAP
jgi:hypothetical protein